ncbi:MAG: tetratricopeptide repeat protein, partial [Planctomycetota bacterium]
RLLDEALEMAAKAIADNPADEAARLWQAHLLNVAKQSDKAIEGLEAFCQSQEGSRSFDAFLALGELYRVRGETDTCRRMIDKAAELRPDSPALILARLRLLGTLGRFGEVAALARQHHKSPTGDIGVIMTAAAILVTSNNVEDCKQAVTIYENVTEAEPWSIDAKLGLAAAAVMTGDIDRAEKIYRQLLEDNPDNPQALNDLAWLLTRYRKLHTSALSLAERGLAIAPTNRHLLDTRGEILLHLPGRLDDAKRDFEKVLAMVPEGSREQAKALLQLGRAHAKLGDLPEARSCFRKARAIDQRRSVFTDKERKEISGIIDSTPKS